MFTVELMQSLFPSGGESYSYDEIRDWCIVNLGLSEQQIKGVVGNLMSRKLIYIATNATLSQSAIYVR